MLGRTVIQPPPYQDPVVETIIRQNNFKPAMLYDYNKRFIEALPMQTKESILANWSKIGSSNTHPRYRIIQPALDFSTDKAQMKV